MATVVSLADVVDALELAGTGLRSYVNVKTGEVRTLGEEEIRSADMVDDDEMPNLLDWERESVAQVREVLDSGDWIDLPDKFDLNEWQLMDEFGRTLTTERARRTVADSLRGRGAFRRFKDTIRRLEVEEAWFKYRRLALKQLAREWLEDNDLEGDAPPPPEEATDSPSA